MKAPWTGTTGLSRAAAILATVFLISLGMCGVNYAAFIRFVPLNDSSPGPHWWSGGILSTTGTLELIGIAVGLVGLIAGLNSKGSQF